MGVDYYKDDDDFDFQLNEKDLYDPKATAGNTSEFFGSNDMVKLVKTYLDNDLPDDIKENKSIKEFWGVLGNSIKLTFLDKEDYFEFEALYDQARCNYVMSKPANEFGFEDMKLLDQMKIYFLASIKRAIGSATHRFNERIVLGGQIHQVIRSNTESLKTGNSGGGGLRNMLSRLF